MRLVFALMLVAIIAFSVPFTACKSSIQTFCDTTCNSDTLRFTIEHPDKPMWLLA
ncbi:MAG: hypothetical protein WDO71_14805 [Bacteroidota bacterium]